MNRNSIFVLQDDVRLLSNRTSEFRLRRGIWNYEEAEININEFSDSFKSFFEFMIDNICEEGFRTSHIEESKLREEEKETLKSLLEQLEASNYILNIDSRDLNRELSFALLGYNLVKDNNTADEQNLPEILIFTDNIHAKENIQNLSSTMNLKITFASNEDYSLLLNNDLTSKIDGLTTEDIVYKLKNYQGKYKAILACFSSISPKLIRNLNRISLIYHIPMVVSFIDGPMISVLSTNPYESGCFECFENRSLARIQDHVLFQEFAKNAKKRRLKNNTCLTPIMNILANISLAECYLYAYYGSSRFEGRLLSIFIPTLEIQVQDVLRIPFCDACGMVAAEQLKEKNISTRALIDNLIKNIN